MPQWQPEWDSFVWGAFFGAGVMTMVLFIVTGPLNPRRSQSLQPSAEEKALRDWQSVCKDRTPLSFPDIVASYYQDHVFDTLRAHCSAHAHWERRACGSHFIMPEWRHCRLWWTRQEGELNVTLDMDYTRLQALVAAGVDTVTAMEEHINPVRKPPNGSTVTG